MKNKCEEMEKFRHMLDINGISWHDASELGLIYGFGIERTKFKHRGYYWSVIHGYGTYGGFNRSEHDQGLLELMSNAVNDGQPVGWLTAEKAIALVKGEDK